MGFWLWREHPLLLFLSNSFFFSFLLVLEIKAGSRTWLLCQVSVSGLQHGTESLEKKMFDELGLPLFLVPSYIQPSFGTNFVKSFFPPRRKGAFCSSFSMAFHKLCYGLIFYFTSTGKSYFLPSHHTFHYNIFAMTQSPLLNLTSIFHFPIRCFLLVLKRFIQ